MLAAGLELVVAPTAEGLGMTVDGSNNAIQEIKDGGAAAVAGFQPGDLILEIDGTRVTECDMQPGPADGAVLVTSEPQSTMGAHVALIEGVASHTFHILRQVNPESIRASPPVSAQTMPTSPPPPLPDVAPAPAPTPSSVDPGANPLEHYPWATHIALPDETFGRNLTQSTMKTKYNLPVGSVLPPMPTITATQESLARKAMFSSR